MPLSAGGERTGGQETPELHKLGPRTGSREQGGDANGLREGVWSTSHMAGGEKDQNPAFRIVMKLFMLIIG